MSREAVIAAFASLKADFRDERFPVIAGRLAGECLVWGEQLLTLFAHADRDALRAVDALARFWVVRFRGMPEPADLGGAGPGPAFVLAFTAFPYLDVMMEAWELGEVVAEQGPDRMTLRCLFDGEDQGTLVSAERAGGGWRFDLMGLYRAKAQALETFIQAEFGDFDAFLDHYVAEHDLNFIADQAWRPLAEK
ncbi:hypothetical protein CCC_02214 [Paramagnetospirillum magnetotacticum MS-1]|uniref:Uncharacterized protein n=1 Tax=Paramagnetospirillum magnetotacticum MS-1 TaxID=272627 RepID=A0A0C2YG75_PARME|nr:hypothetical protein [Paramagnetospirillum magnetotacticum]KIL98764.1 hypothetical protein CCC_02214 [Paramagnetospirillum magnetotacticum MS-1]